MYKLIVMALLVLTILTMLVGSPSLTGANVQGNISLCLYTFNPLTAIPDQNITVGEDYNFTIPCQSYCNETIVTSFIALPYGCNANLTNIQLNTSTGIISGTPNASEVGTFLMIIRCKIANCCWDTEMFYLTINLGNTSNMTNTTNVTLPAPNISISYDGNVSVNWSDENASSYTVFYSSNISAIVLLNTSNIPSDVYNVSGITALNWTDLNHSDDTRRYYTVASVNGTSMNLSLDMPVGKNTWNLTVPVSLVYGPLASQYVSLYLENNYTASTLLDFIPISLNPAISKQLKSDGGGEYIETHVKGLAVNNFNISLNEAYVISVDDNVSHTFVGRVIKPPYIINYSVYSSSVFGPLASNFRGPFDTARNVDANSYLSTVNTSLNPAISRLLKSDGAGEYYDTYVGGFAGGAWSVEPGVGYVVTVDNNFSHITKPLEVNDRW